MGTIYKFALVIMFLVVVFNLGHAFYFLMTGKGGQKATVRALTWRIGLSIGLIAMVGFGYLMGWLHPHGVVR